MAINPDKCIKVTGRFHSTQGTVGEPALTNVVAGADEVYDDTVPYRYNGHIDCKEVTPVGTENPQELEWYEKVYNTLEPTLFEWVKTTDTSVDSEKTYGISIGAKQSDVNKQLYDRLDDFHEITINADDVSKVITSDANKIINKEDGYVPTAAAVGEALGANFEDSLTSTSIVKGLTANMGRELNEIKANKNGWYEQLVSGASLSLIGDDIDHKATFLERETGDSTATGGINYSVDKGTATIETIYGHTEKFNQLIKNGNFASTDNWTAYNTASFTVSNNVASFVVSAYGGKIVSDTFSVISGHIYLIKTKVSNNDHTSVRVRINKLVKFARIATNGKADGLLTADSTNTATVEIADISTSDFDTTNVYSVIVIDLTAIFGAGNEPATVEEFEAWLANNIGIQDYYDYTQGTLISLNPDSLVSTGFNQWDEEWRTGFLNTNGTINNSERRICPDNYIPVIAGQTYYCNEGIYYCVYDADKNMIGSRTYSYTTLTIPANGCYLKFMTDSNYTTTYNHDICINLSDPAKNGTYEPYRKPSTVDLSWIKDIPDPNDSSKKLFPYGLLKAGNICDEVTATKAIKKVGVLDLGTLNWQSAGDYRIYTGGPYNMKSVTDISLVSNGICDRYSIVSRSSIINLDMVLSLLFDLTSNRTTINIVDKNHSTVPSSADNWLSGVMLYYELATPIEVTFEESDKHPMNYEVEDGGREKILPENTSTPTTTSLVADIRYPLNALEAIRNLQNNFSTQGALYQTFNSLCSALNSAITTGTFTVAPDETVVGKFNFTYTPTENTQSVEPNETI